MKFKYLLVSTLMMLLGSGCDPVSNMEATITNVTAQALTIEFISADESSNKTLQIPPNGIELFQEGFDIGSTFIEPSLIAYDSVVIKNEAAQILRVYKENDTGKNIYNIDAHWSANEPSKRFYTYQYKIESQDIE